MASNIKGAITWATILVPSAITGVDHMIDREELTLAHELGHALGFGHACTPLLGEWLYGAPRGHLMNPTLQKTGWDMSGIN